MLCTSSANTLNFTKAQTPAKQTFAFRNMYLVIDIDTHKNAISKATGQKLYGGHMQLRVDGTSTNGPLIIELGIQNKIPSYVVKVKDLGVANTGKPISPQPPMRGYIRHVVRVGQTTLPNIWLFDHEEGTGLVADAWNDDPVYAIGTGSKPNSCIELLERVLQRLQLRVHSTVKVLMDNMREYYTSYSRRMVDRIQNVASIEVSPEDSITRWRLQRIEIRVFNVDFVENPQAPTLVMEDVVFRPEGRAVSEECCPID